MHTPHFLYVLFIRGLHDIVEELADDFVAQRVTPIFFRASRVRRSFARLYTFSRSRRTLDRKYGIFQRQHDSIRSIYGRLRG